MLIFRLELELDQMDAEKSDKFSKWRKWREKVRALLDGLQGKLHKVKNSGTPKNRKVVEENIATIKVFLLGWIEFCKFDIYFSF